MSYETRAYDNEHGDPVVVLVTTGTHDVSRLVNLLAGSRMALCEHIGVSEDILRQVKRHNGGRAALKLLAAHGGPDLSKKPDPLQAEVDRLRRGMRDLYARWIQRAHDNGDYYNRTGEKYENGKAVAFDAAAEEIRLLMGEEAVKVAAEASQAEQNGGQS